MTRMKKVVVGVGLAGVLVMAGWGAWSIWPMPTQKFWREGGQLLTERHIRHSYWLEPSLWQVGRATLPTSTGHYYTNTKRVTVPGALVVEDWSERAWWPSGEGWGEEFELQYAESLLQEYESLPPGVSVDQTRVWLLLRAAESRDAVGDRAKAREYGAQAVVMAGDPALRAQVEAVVRHYDEGGSGATDR